MKYVKKHYKITKNIKKVPFPHKTQIDENKVH